MGVLKNVNGIYTRMSDRKSYIIRSIPPQHLESTSMAARLGGRASLTLKPSNESVEGESGRQSAIVTSTRCRSRARGSDGRRGGLNDSRCGRAGTGRRHRGSSRVGRLGGRRGGRSRTARSSTARRNRSTRCLVGGSVVAIVVVGDVDVGVVLLVRARDGDGRSAGAATSASDLELCTPDVKLTTAERLGGVQGKHLRAEQVFSAGKASRQLEFVAHVVRAHNFAGPLSADIVKLINLEPAIAFASSSRSIIDCLEVVCDGTRVSRLVPLDLDGVTSAGIEGLDGRAVSRRDVASHVFARHVHDRAVVWWHADAALVARSHIVDPNLVEVLMSRDGRDESGSKECLGEHLDVSERAVAVLICTVTVVESDPGSR